MTSPFGTAQQWEPKAKAPAGNDTESHRGQLRRLAALTARKPTAMASPPTVAMGAANAASAIPSAVQIDPADASFRFACGKWIQFGGFWQGVSNNNGADWDLTSYGEIEFGWYGQKIDLRVIQTSPVGRIRVRVDGEYVSLAATQLQAADGNVYNIEHDFASAGLRNIVVELDNAGWVGVNIEPTASLFLPPPRATRALFLGDSYTELTAATETVVNGFPLEVCRRLGWDEPWICGEGATGYLNDGSASGAPGRTTFRNRLVPDVYSAKPDVIVVWGGLNDATGDWTQAQIQDEVAAFLADINTNAPKGMAGYTPQLFIIGCQQPSGSPSALVTSTNDAIKTACLNAGVTFIDTTGWITGTGFAGALTGSGNGDVFISSDGVHPNDDGHLYFGRRIAAAIAATFDGIA
jgi:lysophospholipase L1-like esterase